MASSHYNLFTLNVIIWWPLKCVTSCTSMDGTCLATVMGRCTVSMVTSDHPWFRCAASWQSNRILLMDALFFPSAVWNLAQMFFSWIDRLQDWAQRFSVHISDVSSKQMQHASEGSSVLCHLAKNLIPSLPVLAAGIYGLYWRDSPATVSGRTGTLTVSSGIPFFSWSLVPDMFRLSAPDSEPLQRLAMQSAALCSQRWMSRFRTERRIRRCAPPASGRVCELVRARLSNGIFCPWTPRGPFSQYVHFRGIHLLLIYFTFLTVDYDS